MSVIFHNHYLTKLKNNRYALVGIDTMSKLVVVSTCTNKEPNTFEKVRKLDEVWENLNTFYTDNGGPFCCLR